MIVWRRPCAPCLACAAAFVVISAVILTGLFTPLDDAMLLAIGAVRSDVMTAFMHGVSALGDGVIEIPIAFGLMAVLWRMIGSSVAKRYFLCAVTGEVVYVIAKAVFQRPRPDIIPRLGSAGWYSYPSGHAMLAPIVYSVALLLLLRVVHGRGARAALIAVAVLLPLAMAMSRVYLGVHYPSDVLGALALGAGWGFLWFGGDASSKCDTSASAATI